MTVCYLYSWIKQTWPLGDLTRNIMWHGYCTRDLKKNVSEYTSSVQRRRQRPDRRNWRHAGVSSALTEWMSPRKSPPPQEQVGVIMSTMVGLFGLTDIMSHEHGMCRDMIRWSRCADSTETTRQWRDMWQWREWEGYARTTRGRERIKEKPFGGRTQRRKTHKDERLRRRFL